MHITQWEAARSGAGITVAMTDAGGVKRKQFVKKIVSENGTVTAIGGDGAKFPLNAGRETSADVASIAGDLLDLNGEQVHGLSVSAAVDLAAKVRELAASALGQRVA